MIAWQAADGTVELARLPLRLFELEGGGVVSCIVLVFVTNDAVAAEEV